MDVDLKIGDVFLCRNDGKDESQNQSPGYFNHAAIYIGEGLIEEAQFSYGVIRVKAKNFFDRYPIIVQVRHRDEKIGEKAGEIAKKYLGNSYWKISSIFLNLRNNKRGDNCIGLVRRCYFDASGQDYLYKIPDHVYKDTGHFKIMSKKYNEKWTVPINPFDGIVPIK